MKKSKSAVLAEQRAKIKQLRLEATDPTERDKRLQREQDDRDRKTAIAKEKLEIWRLMKMLKGEWDPSISPKFDIDYTAQKCSVKGRSV